MYNLILCVITAYIEHAKQKLISSKKANITLCIICVMIIR